MSLFFYLSKSFAATLFKLFSSWFALVIAFYVLVFFSSTKSFAELNPFNFFLTSIEARAGRRTFPMVFPPSSSSPDILFVLLFVAHRSALLAMCHAISNVLLKS